MFSVDPVNKSPIYKQIIDQVLLLLSSGILRKGDQLPSIRDLASELGINPNTVARSYRELEAMKIIVSVPKKGSFITKSNLDSEIRNQALTTLTEWVEKFTKLGLDQENLKDIFKEVVNA